MRNARRAKRSVGFRRSRRRAVQRKTTLDEKRRDAFDALNAYTPSGRLGAKQRSTRNAAKRFGAFDVSNACSPSGPDGSAAERRGGSNACSPGGDDGSAQNNARREATRRDSTRSTPPTLTRRAFPDSAAQRKKTLGAGASSVLSGSSVARVDYLFASRFAVCVGAYCFASRFAVCADSYCFASRFVGLTTLIASRRASSCLTTLIYSRRASQYASALIVSRRASSCLTTLICSRRGLRSTRKARSFLCRRTRRYGSKRSSGRPCSAICFPSRSGCG